MAPQERIAVYVQNQSVQKVTFSEIRFAGSVYSFVSAPGGVIDDYDPAGLVGTLSSSTAGYMIATKSDATPGPAVVLDTTSAEIQPGQQATIIIQLDENVKVGRDAQIKLSTNNGAVFVGTVIVGQQSG